MNSPAPGGRPEVYVSAATVHISACSRHTVATPCGTDRALRELSMTSHATRYDRNA